MPGAKWLKRTAVEKALKTLENREILVAQLGARRHYAVPLALHAQRSLGLFCTDIFVRHRFSRSLIHKAAKITGIRTLQQLSGRNATALPVAKVRTFPLFGLAYKLRSRWAVTPSHRVATWLWAGQKFAELAAQELHNHCDSVYGFTSAAKELFECARTLGVNTILDHATAPRRFETTLIREEAERFPGWAISFEEDCLTDRFQARQNEEVVLADSVVCASSFVKNVLISEGCDPQKISVVPLGISDRFFNFRLGRRQVHGTLRVLFVGGDGLRKGIGHLAKAIRLLGTKAIVVKVAGDLEISEAGHKELNRTLELLGPVPRTQIEALFQWADVLALPSVSDTFGLVVLEAMAAGIPVIATVNTCGPDVIRDAIDGFVVPIRDPESIADRLDCLASDAKLLSTMSYEAHRRARNFTVDRYGERLVAAI